MYDLAFQSDIISTVKNIAIFLVFMYLAGASLMWIVCDAHDIECRRRARDHGVSLPPMGFREKLKFILLWPFYLVFF